jgi:transcriptional regulator with XRE-family HTH domain
LEKWNKGVLRGAQAKLAKSLNVSTATVALWATGKRSPSKGYITQMAQLFGLDSYDVMRLFQQSTTYPDTQSSTLVNTLRDAQDPALAYTADKPSSFSDTASNSVHIPLLHTLPLSWPNYQEEDICEWWTLPRAAAKGAKFLLKNQSLDKNTSSEDLFLIKPVTAICEHALMLIRVGGTPLLRRIYTQQEQVCICSVEGQLLQTLPISQVTPLGEVVIKIIHP